MTDKSQVIATVGDLLAVGAKAGAARILFNASLIAQREAAEGRDLAQVSGLIQPAPDFHPANDHGPSPSKTA